MNRYKPTGWKYESYRHSLAARGIPTGRFAAHKYRFAEKDNLPSVIKEPDSMEIIDSDIKTLGAIDIPVSKDVSKDAAVVLEGEVLNERVNNQIKEILKDIKEHPEKLEEYMARESGQLGLVLGVNKKPMGMDEEGNITGGQIVSVDVNREMLYDLMKMTPDQRFSLKAYLEDLEATPLGKTKEGYDLFGPRKDVSGNLTFGQRPKGGKVVPLEGISKEEFLEKFDTLPPYARKQIMKNMAQSGFLKKYSKDLLDENGNVVGNMIGNVMAREGVTLKDVQNPERFMLLPYNTQRRILSAMKSVELENLQDPEGYIKKRVASIERAEEEGGIFHKIDFGTKFTGDIRKIETADEARKEIDLLKTKLELGYKLSPGEYKYFVGLNKWVDDNDSITRGTQQDIVTIRVNAAKDALKYLKKEVKAGNIDKEQEAAILKKYNEDMESLVKPYEEELASKNKGYQEKVNESIKKSMEWAKTGRVHKIESISNNINSLANLKDKDFWMDLAEADKRGVTSINTIKRDIENNGSRIGYHNREPVANILKKQLDSAMVQRKLEMKSSRDSEAVLEGKERAGRMHAGKGDTVISDRDRRAKEVMKRFNKIIKGYLKKGYDVEVTTTTTEE